MAGTGLTGDQAPTIRRAAKGREGPRRAAKGREGIFWPPLVGFFRRAAKGREGPRRAAKGREGRRPGAAEGREGGRRPRRFRKVNFCQVEQFLLKVVHATPQNVGNCPKRPNLGVLGHFGLSRGYFWVKKCQTPTNGREKPRRAAKGREGPRRAAKSREGPFLGW